VKQDDQGSGRFATALRVLDRLEEILIAFLIAMSTIIIFVAVLQRYGISSAASLMHWSKAHGIDWLAAVARFLFVTLKSFRFTWAQELAIFMMVWMAKFGAAYGVRTGIHVGVDILVNTLTGERQRTLILIGLLGGALFTGLIGILGLRLVLHIAAGGQTSAVLELPMWFVYAAVPAGSFLMCFRFLQVAWTFMRTGERPLHDPGAVEGLDEPAEVRSP
jgi:TRAP-type C4-dicarboxylate transport system permease small subunit